LIDHFENNSELQERAKILVVEDNPVENLLISKMLQNANFEVLSIECGRGVLDSVISYHPDLILLDALMPDIDGFEVCELIRQQPIGEFIPVIMLTGLDDMASIDRAYDVGATDFFTKPINNSMLVHRIRYLLRAREIMDQLRMSEQSLASAQRAAKMAHWVFDVNKQAYSLTAEVQQLYKLPANYDNKDRTLLLQCCHPGDRAGFQASIDGCLQNHKETHIEHRFISEGADVRYFEVHLSVMKGGDGEITHLLGLSIDITERKESEQQILRLAYCDRLTNLPNRYLLELYVDQAIPAAHMQGRSVAMLGIDLDLFNRINNSMGHSAGDEVLTQLSERLVNIQGCGDVSVFLNTLAMPSMLGEGSAGMVARLAADTFVLVLPMVDRGSEQAERLADTIKTSFQSPFVYRGQELFVTASIGITYSDSGGSQAASLLQQVDLAIHEAKTHGHNVVMSYSGDLVSKVSKHLAIQSDLRKALRNNEFQIFYQPKISVVTGAVMGFEALVRWFHPEKGMIPPDQFITIAEETGQIVELGQWVLESACRQNQQWIESGLVDVRVAVNVAARQFKEGDLVAVVADVLARTGMNERNLELEITESVLIADPDTGDHMKELRARGVTMALDDFGTGYSSLSYITRFPIDTIKIDRSFIKDITLGSEQAAIVSAVTYLAHELKFKVVAEGVETDTELEVVKKLQCDEVQGYYYCKPMSAVDVAAWLHTRSQSEPIPVESAK